MLILTLVFIVSVDVDIYVNIDIGFYVNVDAYSPGGWRRTVTPCCSTRKPSREKRSVHAIAPDIPITLLSIVFLYYAIAPHHSINFVDIYMFSVLIGSFLVFLVMRG